MDELVDRIAAKVGVDRMVAEKSVGRFGRRGIGTLRAMEHQDEVTAQHDALEHAGAKDRADEGRGGGGRHA